MRDWRGRIHLNHTYTFPAYVFLSLRCRFSTGGAKKCKKRLYRVQSLMYILASRHGGSPSSRPSIQELDCPPFNPLSEFLGINKSEDLQSGENKTKQHGIEAKRFRSQIATHDRRQPFPCPDFELQPDLGAFIFFYTVHTHYLSGKLHG